MRLRGTVRTAPDRSVCARISAWAPLSLVSDGPVGLKRIPNGAETSTHGERLDRARTAARERSCSRIVAVRVREEPFDATCTACQPGAEGDRCSRCDDDRDAVRGV